jgi:hypothetical protein
MLRAFLVGFFPLLEFDTHLIDTDFNLLRAVNSPAHRYSPAVREFFCSLWSFNANRKFAIRLRTIELRQRVRGQGSANQCDPKGLQFFSMGGKRSCHPSRNVLCPIEALARPQECRRRVVIPSLNNCANQRS